MYTFKILHDDGRTGHIVGYGDTKEEAYNNALERLPSTAKIIENDDSIYVVGTDGKTVCEKITLSKLQEMGRNGEFETAIIVFTVGSFNKEYSLNERSYRVNSQDKYFKPAMLGNALFGSSLDGSDNGVRLNDRIYYDGWDVEYCYIEK